MKSKIIQNSESSSMLEACKAAASTDLAKAISIATAYISLPGLLPFSKLIDEKGIKNIRVLLGVLPSRRLSGWQQPSKDHLKAQAERKRSNLVKQCSLAPFEKEPRADLQILGQKAQEGGVQIRIYEENFMHAKTYIFSDEPGKEGKIIVGSSNLTGAGLKHNMEMNISNEEEPLFEEAMSWFNDLWEQSKEMDLSQAVQEATELKTPYEIFLRVLWEVYKDDLGNQASNARLTSFQLHGADRALRILKQRRGAILADEVGLGKTYIAGEIIKEYHKNGQRALIICPAALREAIWGEHLLEMSLPSTKILSYEQFGKNWEQAIDEHQLIVIDEAHNYRNLKAPQRGGALTSFLRGRRRDVLMLTATPVNNSLWDLYRLMMYFLKQDTAFSDKRIPSIKGRFGTAMESGDYSRIPNLLFDIIDATTVKRTRKFIKQFYGGQLHPTNEGEKKIVFPTPIPSTINYALDEEMPAVYGMVEKYLDFENADRLKMAIYKTKYYRLKGVTDIERKRLDAMSGLVMSGLLKRFESSEAAFRKSLQRKIALHEKFLEKLEQGHVIGKAYFDNSLEFSDDDDDYEFDDKDLDISEYPASEQYNSSKLKEDVSEDLVKLKEIYNKLRGLTPSDAKYRRVVEELELIVKNASKAKDARSRRDRSKVIIFSFYADTAKKIFYALEDTIKKNRKLSCYRDKNEKLRIALVTGEHKRSRAEMAKSFAPRKNGGNDSHDKVDILVSTDVMAEGVNLQQAGNLINYDLPWNPMRLVQRHGRLDRIDSEHKKIYLRSVFPDDRLDGLLKLKDKIDEKISWAASSIGVISPVKAGVSHDRVFADTRKEIHKIRAGDPSIYENSGMGSNPRSGEEYRQILRDELEQNKEPISKLPLQSGSIMCKGNSQGMYFLAEIKRKLFHCFIHTNKNWKPTLVSNLLGNKVKCASTDLGNCLSIIECLPEQETIRDNKVKEKAYGLWPQALEIIKADWEWHTKPKNLQPKITGINRRVDEFLRKRKSNLNDQVVDRAYRILNAPWPHEYQVEMRKKFNNGQGNPTELYEQLVDYINNCGLDPAEYPEPFDEITDEDIQLIVWMAVLPEKK